MTGALVAVFLGVAGLVVYGLFAWERIVHRRRTAEAGGWGATPQARAARPDPTPDLPRPFGADTAWLAVRTRDAAAVAQQLALRTVLPANWRAGLDEVRERGVFVTPAVDGWVFAVGRDLLAADGDDAALVAPLLEQLSRTFGGAAWFAADRDAERFGWALALGGELQRGYAFAGEHGEVWSSGAVTAAERAAGCFVDDPRDQSDDEVKWWPDLAIVQRIAAAWSLDPSRLDERDGQAGCGCVGRR